MISNLTALAAARESALPEVRVTGLAGRPAALYCSAEAHYSRRARRRCSASARERAGASRSTTGAGCARGGAGPAIDATWPRDHAGRGGRHGRHDADRRGRPDRGGRRRLLRPRRVAARRRRLRPAGRGHRHAVRCSRGSTGPTRSSSTRTSGCTCRRPAASSSCASAPPWRARSCTRRRYMLHDDARLNAVDRTLEYSRPFRALKLWLAFRVHGAAAFREAIDRNLALARASPTPSGSTTSSSCWYDPQLSTVPFRHTPPGVADLDAHNLPWLGRSERRLRVYVSSADDRRPRVPAAVHRQLPHHGGGRRRAGRGDARARARAGRRYPDVLTASVMPSATGRTTVARSARATRAAFRSRSASMSPCAQPPPVR